MGGQKWVLSRELLRILERGGLSKKPAFSILPLHFFAFHENIEF